MNKCTYSKAAEFEVRYWDRRWRRVRFYLSLGDDLTGENSLGPSDVKAVIFDWINQNTWRVHQHSVIRTHDRTILKLSVERISFDQQSSNIRIKLRVSQKRR